MHKSIVVFVLFYLALVNAQCSCQTKPPIDRIYEGESCQCGCKSRIDAPKITKYGDAHYDYGYKIENPQEPSASPSEVKYSFDFHVEKPQSPPPSASLLNYGFQVDAPSQKPVEQLKRYALEYQIQNPVDTPDVANINLDDLNFKVVSPSEKSVEPPKRYAFEYVVQTPSTTNNVGNLEDLLARIAAQKRGVKKGHGCKCNCYKPTLANLQSCPKHGYLYQCGGPLNPSNQQRYNEALNLQQQMPIQQITTVRSKRDVSNTFPTQIQLIDLLPGLRPNNQINKMLTAEQENQNRIDEIMKKNFGIDPEDNIEELVRPKPLNSMQSVQSDLNENEDTVVSDSKKLQTPDFIGKMKPKMEEIRNNMKKHISKIVNRARLEAILNNHMIQKRSSQSDNSDLANLEIDAVGHERWLTESSVDTDKLNQNSENRPENVEENKRHNAEPIRKYCDRCGELARKYPCPSCGDRPSEHSQPQYFEIKQGNIVPFVPGNTRQLSDNTQPRYVFDRFGHRYVEHNGKLKLIVPEQGADDVTVGSYNSNPAYSEVKGILDRNSDIIHMNNRRIGEGHILQPLNLAHATDAIRFIQELTHTNHNQYNRDYDSNGDSYDVSRTQNRPAKRSFKIIPLAEDKDDGSVLVKITPTEPLKKSKNLRKKFNSKTKIAAKAYADDNENFRDSEENIFGEEKTNVKANFEKVIRDGKKYEILALSENGSDEGSLSSDENMEVMKYVYAANYKEPGDESHQFQ